MSSFKTKEQEAREREQAKKATTQSSGESESGEENEQEVFTIDGKGLDKAQARQFQKMIKKIKELGVQLQKANDKRDRDEKEMESLNMQVVEAQTKEELK